MGSRNEDAWLVTGKFSDFINGDPGCCVVAILMAGSLVFGGCGIARGIKAIIGNKDNKPKTEQVTSKRPEIPANTIVYNNVKTR